MESLEKHVSEVKGHELLRGADIDFKIAPSTGPVNAATQEQTGFTRLTVNVCQVHT